MIRRATLLTDGASDRPLAAHLAAMCAERGARVNVTAPDFGLIERLDRSGPVSQLLRWQALEADLDRVLSTP